MSTLAFALLVGKLEVLEHAKRAVDHLPHHITLVRHPHFAHVRAAHHAVTADKAKHPGEHLIAARSVVTV